MSCVSCNSHVGIIKKLSRPRRVGKHLGSSLCLVLHHLAALAVAAPPASAAGDKHEDRGDEREDGRDESDVDGRAVAGVAGSLFDLLDEEVEGDKGDDDSDGVDDEGQS